MKKVILLLVTVVLGIWLIACGTTESNAPASLQQQESEINIERPKLEIADYQQESKSGLEILWLEYKSFTQELDVYECGNSPMWWAKDFY